MAIDRTGINTDPNYAHSFDVNFKTTPSPVPGQRTAYNEFNKNFTDFLGGQETVSQLQDRYANKYNIPFLTQQATAQNAELARLGSSIQALPSSVASASGNSMLTSGQKDRVVQAQSAPLMQDYTKLGSMAGQTNQQLGMAQEGVNTAISLEQAQQEKMTQPWLQAYEANTIMNAAEMTAWNFENSKELERLLANQKAGMTLSEAQQTRLADLAMKEAEFQSALEVQRIKNMSPADQMNALANMVKARNGSL